jgi:hypothetical protein
MQKSGMQVDRQCGTLAAPMTTYIDARFPYSILFKQVPEEATCGGQQREVPQIQLLAYDSFPNIRLRVDRFLLENSLCWKGDDCMDLTGFDTS